MATKTINLTGAEVAVTGLDGAHAHIRNDSTEVIYAAKTAGITAGADGVASIPAGQADTLRGISGAVYLLGTGSALIQSDDYVESPFKASTASGGSAVDDVARAAVNAHAGNADIHVTAAEKASWNAKANKSEIPETLPAAGGNADRIKWANAEHATDILSFAESAADGQRTYVRIYGSPTCPTNYGYDPANNDFWYTIDKLDNDWISITAKDMRTNAEFVNTKSVDGWAGWVKCSDGGNANSLSGRTASEFLRYTAGADGDADTIVSSGIYKGTFANVPEGLPDGQGTLIVLNYLSANEEISGSIGTDTLWLRQWFVCAHGYYVYERSAAGIGVSEWKPINDNGNAATLESHPASDFVLKSDYDALAARVAALEGGTS